jgi:hypothetical protein
VVAPEESVVAASPELDFVVDAPSSLLEEDLARERGASLLDLPEAPELASGGGGPALSFWLFELLLADWFDAAAAGGWLLSLFHWLLLLFHCGADDSGGVLLLLLLSTREPKISLPCEVSELDLAGRGEAL